MSCPRCSEHVQVSTRRAAPLKLGNAAAILSDSPAAALDVKKRLSFTAAGATSKVPAGWHREQMTNHFIRQHPEQGRFCVIEHASMSNCAFVSP